MNILLTGATGFIGSRMALRFRDKGHKVTALALVNNDQEQARKQTLEDQGITVVVGDVTEKQKLAECLQDCDWVFHLAAAQHEANVADDYFQRINVDGTRNLLDAAIEASVKKFVYGSTIGVYGQAMEGELDESSRLEPDNIYGKTKLEAERLVISYQEKLPVVCIRISETYGPGDNRLLKLFKGLKKGTFFVMGSGENLHQLIFVDDLIDGMHAAAEAESGRGEVFVLAGTEKLSTNAMCEAVSAAVDSRKTLFKLPMWPFWIIAIVLEFVCKPLGIQPLLHRRRLDFFRKSFFFRTDKAAHMLAFKPATSFAEGTKITAEWYRHQGLL